MIVFERIAEQLEQLAMLRRMRIKPFLSIEEAAVYTNLSVGYLYQLTHRNEIPHFKKYNKLYFDKEQLTKWMKESPKKTNAEIAAEADRYMLYSRGRKNNRFK